MNSDVGTVRSNSRQRFQVPLRGERVDRYLWVAVFCALAAIWLWGTVAAIVSIF